MLQSSWQNLHTLKKLISMRIASIDSIRSQPQSVHTAHKMDLTDVCHMYMCIHASNGRLHRGLSDSLSLTFGVLFSFSVSLYQYHKNQLQLFAPTSP
jgi:hypothetical protein